ncbi:MAG: serine hydrolase domain-containing protein [Parasphingorhabdus sp.]
MKTLKIKAMASLAGCLLIMSSSDAASGSDFLNKDNIDAIIEDAEKEGFVGVIAISSADQIIYSTGIGEAVSGESRYSDATVVDIASVTKQFTGAAILKLEEDKRLSLDDTLSKYFTSANNEKGAITIHQLLTHTAGFGHHIGRDEEAISKDDYVDRALSSELVGRPGESYRYSNVGYGLLAAIIEAAADEPYENYLFSALWQPAGMFTTGYFRPHWSNRDVPTLEEPFKGLDSALAILEKNGPKSWHLIGNGGVLSTAEDMLKWHQALIGTDILSETSKEKLFASHVSEDEPGFYYGYGWSIVPEHAQGKLVWHNGMSFFGKAEFWRFPESGYAIFIASHSGPVSPYSIASKLAATIHAGAAVEK